jgi:hypothetical protein
MKRLRELEEKSRMITIKESFTEFLFIKKKIRECCSFVDP